MKTRVILVCLVVCTWAMPAAAAVTRLELPGAWYAEALPCAPGAAPPCAYAAAVPGSHVVTHAGQVPLPPQELLANGLGPLYLRATNVGGFKFAGQSHAYGFAWVHDARGWTHDPRIAHGVSGAIFDLAGQLVLSDPSYGSQGFRFVDAGGRIWTGDETYGHPTLRLSEWTAHGDITIGQGWTYAGGAVAVRGTDRRMLEPGHTTFLRFNRAGDRLAIAIVKLLEQKAVLLWLDAADLATFPLEPEPGPIVPPPDPQPEPEPEPDPEPDQRPLPDAGKAKRIVEEERAKFGPMDLSQLAALMRAIAARLNAEGLAGGPFGVLRKTTGHHCEGLSCDIICAGQGDAQRQWDVLEDADPGGAQTPGWSGPLPTIVVRECVIPAGPAPELPPPTCSYPDVRPDLARCSRDAALLQQQLRQAEDARQDAESARAAAEAHAEVLAHERDAAIRERDALANRPPPACRAKVPGWLARLGVRVGCEVIP